MPAPSSPGPQPVPGLPGHRWAGTSCSMPPSFPSQGVGSGPPSPAQPLPWGCLSWGHLSLSLLASKDTLLLCPFPRPQAPSGLQPPSSGSTLPALLSPRHQPRPHPGAQSKPTLSPAGPGHRRLLGPRNVSSPNRRSENVKYATKKNAKCLTDNVYADHQLK